MEFRRTIQSLVILLGATLIATNVLATHAQFYVLDGFGGVHAGGGAPVIAPGTPYFGFDIAKDIAYIPGSTSGGYLVLDGFGGVHVGGTALGNVSPLTPYFGFDVARAISYRNIPPRVASSAVPTANMNVTSATYIAIGSAQISAPAAGSVVTMCSAAIGCIACSQASLGSAIVAVGLDALNETAAINRQVIFSTPGYRAEAWIQTLSVAAGVHTIHCLIKDSTAFPGTTSYQSPTVTALFIDQNGAGVSAPEAGDGGPSGAFER